MSCQSTYDDLSLEELEQRQLELMLEEARDAARESLRGWVRWRHPEWKAIPWFHDELADEFDAVCESTKNEVLAVTLPPGHSKSTYVEEMAARALGASGSRIVFRHILPNSVSTLITFVPFSVASGITALTALDYLGFGLPAPTPSWGELLKQGTENMESLWLVGSVVVAMTLILMLVAYVGEAIRDAYDPRKFSFYE